MAKTKTVYACTECGGQALKWQGQCPHCQAWNTLEETIAEATPSSTNRYSLIAEGGKLQRLSEVDAREEERLSTGVTEFDRVLGGGLVAGGVVLIGGDPGKFVRSLREQEGKEICIMSGGRLAQSLLEARVIDEIGLNVHPVLLGSGIPLFHKMKRQIDLELINCRPMKNGCVYVSYKVKG